MSSMRCTWTGVIAMNHQTEQLDEAIERSNQIAPALQTKWIALLAIYFAAVKRNQLEMNRTR